MNCEHYRQAIGADPSYGGGAEHLRECAACQAYRSEMQALEAMLGRALAIDVPEATVPDLPEPGVDTVVPIRHRRPAAPAWLALAATVAIAAVLGVRMLGTGVRDERLHSVVPGSIADLDHAAGLITYAQTCIINGKRVPHLIIQGTKGPITVLLMPEEPVARAVELAGQNVNGVILPVGGGSIAIIGAAGEPLDTVREELLQSVTWTT